MQNVDPPIFVLSGILIGEAYYARTLVRRVKEFKERHGLAKNVVLHSRSIRRWEKDFTFLSDPRKRIAFYKDINEIFCKSRIRVYAVVIDKRLLKNRFIAAVNPYDLSLSLLLSQICGPPGRPGAWKSNIVRITAESRGKREDKELQNVYQGFKKVGFHNYGAVDVQSRRPVTVKRFFPAKVDFAKKRKAIAGLELADLAAYPIAWAARNQVWSNPAYQVVAQKLRGTVFFP